MPIHFGLGQTTKRVSLLAQLGAQDLFRTKGFLVFVKNVILAISFFFGQVHLGI